MANEDIVWVREGNSGRTGSPWTAGGHRDYFREFFVRTTNRRLGAAEIVLAPGVPGPYQSYATSDSQADDLAALMVAYDAVEKEPGEKIIWKIVCRYSTHMPEGGPAYFSFPGNVAVGAQNNPEIDPAHIEWDWEIVQRAVPTDLDGKAILTSAQLPFQPAYGEETARPVLIITRNENNFTRAAASNYAFAVNGDRFLGARPGTVRCSPPRAVLSWRGSIGYWRTTWRLTFGAPKIYRRTNKIIGKNPSQGEFPPGECDPQQECTLACFGGQWTWASTPCVNCSFCEGVEVGSSCAEGPNVTEGRCGYGSNAMGNFIQGFFDKIGDLESWQPELLDQGLMELQSIPFGPHFQFPVPIIRFGQPVTQPMLLDGAGHEQKPDANGFRKPVYLNFRTRHYMPFNKIFTRGLGALGI